MADTYSSGHVQDIVKQMNIDEVTYNMARSPSDYQKDKHKTVKRKAKEERNRGKLTDKTTKCAKKVKEELYKDEYTDEEIMPGFKMARADHFQERHCPPRLRIILLLSVFGILTCAVVFVVLQAFSLRFQQSQIIDNQQRELSISQEGGMASAQQQLAKGRLRNVDDPLMIAWRNDRLIQDCHTTNLKQTFPDIGYSFYGYNALKGYPLADGKDPGFTRPIFSSDFSNGEHTADCRYVLPRGLIAEPDVSCVTSFTSQTVENSHDFQKSLEVSAKLSGGGFGVSFSASFGYKNTMSTVSTGKTKFIISSASCKYYFTKLKELAMPQLSTEMIGWIEKLNKSVDNSENEDDLFNFIEYFGTNFMTGTIYGARFTHEHKISSESLKQLKEKSISAEAQAGYSGLFSISGGFGMSNSQKEAAQSFQEKVETRTISVGAPPPYNGDAMTWASNVKESPVPVQYDLVPIYELFNPKYQVDLPITLNRSQLIRKRIKNYVKNKYCSKLLNQGANVECTDKSILTITGLRFTGKKGLRELEVSSSQCIDECYRDKSCMAAFWSNNCNLIVSSQPLGNFRVTKEDSDKTRVIQEKLTEPLTLKHVTVPSSMQQRRTLVIKDTTDINILHSFCYYECSSDSLCTGYTVISHSDYTYNCALYAGTTYELEGRSNGHVRIVSATLKERFLAEKRRTPIKVRNVTVDVTFTPANDDDNNNNNDNLQNCEETCVSKAGCIVSYIDQNTCKQVSDAHLKLRQNNSELIIYPQNAHGDWFNVTNIMISSDCRTYLSEPNDECLSKCAENATCVAAQFSSNRCVHLTSKVPPGVTKTCLEFQSDSEVFFPTDQLKINKIVLDNNKTQKKSS